MSFALAVLPLLMIIATGYVLARTGALPQADWKGIETLCFRILIPAVLILAITRPEMSLGHFSGYMIALVISTLVMAALAMLPRLIPTDELSNPSFTSIFQGGVRWNAFVALAAIEQFLGNDGLAGFAVAIALLIPTINVTCIALLATFGPEKTSLSRIIKQVLKNPLVQACLIGLGLKFSGISLPVPVVDALEMVGRGALAVGLMAIGAGISLRRLLRWDWKVAVTLLMRPILAPAVFAALALILGLDPVLTLVGVLIFAAPAATNGYIIAKQMGGDSGLYADILTWQTVLSLLVLPFWGWALIG